MIAILTVGTIYALSTQTIHSKGQLRTEGLSVWQDGNCTTTLTEIDWGLLERNLTYMRKAWVRNEGNVNGTLSMNLTNWSPAQAASMFFITWNSEGTAIQPHQIVAVEFNLLVSANASGNFEVDIIISDPISNSSATNSTIKDPGHL